MTFFDYLRRRAYESIMSGVSDAMQSLDGSGSPPPPAATESVEPTSSLPPTARVTQPPVSLPAEGVLQIDAETYLSALSPEERKTLPPPRRRGRPHDPKDKS